MNAFARQRIQVNRQGCHKRFAFARAHFGNFTVVQGNTAKHLHIEVTHGKDALTGLAHHGKSFGQKVVEGDTRGQALAEFGGFLGKLLIGQRLH